MQEAPFLLQCSQRSVPISHECSFNLYFYGNAHNDEMSAILCHLLCGSCQPRAAQFAGCCSLKIDLTYSPYVFNNPDGALHFLLKFPHSKHVIHIINIKLQYFHVEELNYGIHFDQFILAYFYNFDHISLFVCLLAPLRHVCVSVHMHVCVCSGDQEKGEKVGSLFLPCGS